MKPKLDEKGVKLYLISIGTFERAQDFIKETEFPPELMFVDPETVTYEALGLKKGVVQTFFSVNTPLSLGKRLVSGNFGDLKDVLSHWKPWQPPKSNQALQQGGLYVFDGTRTLLAHKDVATGVHADFAEVIAVATKGL